MDYPPITRVTAVFRSREADVEEAATVFAVSESGIAFSIEVSWNLFAEADRDRARGTAYGRDAAPTQDPGRREPIPKRLSPPAGSIRSGGSW